MHNKESGLTMGSVIPASGCLTAVPEHGLNAERQASLAGRPEPVHVAESKVDANGKTGVISLTITREQLKASIDKAQNATRGTPEFDKLPRDEQLEAITEQLWSGLLES